MKKVSIISQSLKTVLLSSIFIAGSVQAEGGGAGGGMNNPFNPGFMELSPNQQKFLLENTGRGRSVATEFDEMIAAYDERKEAGANEVKGFDEMIAQHDSNKQKYQYIKLIMTFVPQDQVNKLIKSGKLQENMKTIIDYLKKNPEKANITQDQVKNLQELTQRNLSEEQIKFLNENDAWATFIVQVLQNVNVNDDQEKQQKSMDKVMALLNFSMALS